MDVVNKPWHGTIRRPHIELSGFLSDSECVVKAVWWPLYVGNDLAVNGNDGNDDSGVLMTVRSEAKNPSVSAISHNDVREVRHNY